MARRVAARLRVRFGAFIRRVRCYQWTTYRAVCKPRATAGGRNMSIALSRRHLFVAGAGALLGASGVARAQSMTRDSTTQDFIRRWYAAWEKTDWSPIDLMLADDFMFTSAAGDDHISKTKFKSQCWESQIGFIDRVD